SNEIPITRVSLSCPVDFHNVGVVDLPESGNFSAHGFVTSSVLEQLECALLALDLVAHPVNLREAALAEDVEDLEPPVDHVAYCVVGGLGADRGLHLGWVRLRQHFSVLLEEL